MYLTAIDELHHAVNLPAVHVPEGEDGALPAVDIALGSLGGVERDARGETKVALVSQVCLERLPDAVTRSAALRALRAALALGLTLPERGLRPALEGKQAPEKVPFIHLDLTKPAAEKCSRLRAPGWAGCHLLDWGGYTGSLDSLP